MSDLKTQPDFPALLSLRDLGIYLGRPPSSLERQLKNPPQGFPLPVRLGRRVFWPRIRVDAWLAGTLLETPISIDTGLQHGKRPRGRPRNQAQVGVSRREVK